MENFDFIHSENLIFFENFNFKYKVYYSLNGMIEDFSGIFITLNSFDNADITFRLMGSYIKKKEDKTKKKQLYSLGLKTVKSIGEEKALQIRKEFEKFVLIFSQMKYYQEITNVEDKKKNLQD